MKYFVFTVAGISLFCFAWARRGFFKRSSQTPVGRNGLGPVGSICGMLVLVHLWIDLPLVSFSFLMFGCGLMILSMLIFWWAVKSFSGIPPNIAATPGEINFLNTKGPYKYVRHPFYLSYIIFWFGASVAVQTIDVLLFVSILVGMYFKAARREEKDIISSAFGDEYLNYKKSVGMFFPMLFRF